MYVCNRIPKDSVHNRSGVGERPKENVLELGDIQPTLVAGELSLSLSLAHTLTHSLTHFQRQSVMNVPAKLQRKSAPNVMPTSATHALRL